MLFCLERSLHSAVNTFEKVFRQRLSGKRWRKSTRRWNVQPRNFAAYESSGEEGRTPDSIAHSGREGEAAKELCRGAADRTASFTTVFCEFSEVKCGP